ncbi:MAG: VanZ family protein, partial [Candidatus Rokuibacteriota bacterium]
APLYHERAMSLSFWLPPIVWMLIIISLSSGHFGSEQTGSILGPLVRWIAPGMTEAQIAAVHLAVRKLAHLAEFAVLGVLWLRVFAGGRGLSPGAATTWALAICVAWAVVDESLQTLVPTRTGSVVDIGIDAVGALIGLAIALAAWRVRARLPWRLRSSGGDRACRADRHRTG